MIKDEKTCKIDRFKFSDEAVRMVERSLKQKSTREGARTLDH